MCCCGKPTMNGQPGYSWDGKTRIVHPVNQPELRSDDILIFDEPGRCGEIDAHCHHFCVVMNRNRLVLVVNHGDTHRFELPWYDAGKLETLKSMSSDSRFWLLMCIYSAVERRERIASSSRDSQWSKAFLEKRIKRRKSGGIVAVWIEPAA